jgi:hypothetical protein
VILDADLQHPPEKIIDMYALWKQGFEVIEGIKSDRGKESAFHKLCSKIFYHAISHAIEMDMNNSSDFKLIVSDDIDYIVHHLSELQSIKMSHQETGYELTFMIDGHIIQDETGSYERKVEGDDDFYGSDKESQYEEIIQRIKTTVEENVKDIEKYRAEQERRRKAEEDRLQKLREESSERATYERLKKKFENS